MTVLCVARYLGVEFLSLLALAKIRVYFVIIIYSAEWGQVLIKTKNYCASVESLRNYSTFRLDSGYRLKCRGAEPVGVLTSASLIRTHAPADSRAASNHRALTFMHDI